MPRGLTTALGITDVAMLLYWALTALAALGAVALPPAALYKDYHDLVLVAWNWSFMPLDLAFAASGLASVARARRGGEWRGLAIVSLSLTMCAGGMALAFWTLRHDFDLGWWLPNLVLLLGPLVWLPKLVR